jgi:hypothetical protein
MGRYFTALVFASVGIALLFTNIWNNAAAINGGELVFNDLTAVVAGMAIGGALLSISIGAVAKKSTVGALLSMLLILGCTATSVHYTLSRIGGVADSSVAVGDNHARQSKLLAAEIDGHKKSAEIWEQRLTDAKTGIANECNGKPPKSLNRKSWPNCRSHDDSADIARDKLASLSAQISTARSALINMGPAPVTSPVAQRYADLVGIPVATYRNAMPIVTAFSLEGLVNMLFVIAGLFMASVPNTSSAPIHQMKDVTPPDPIVDVLQRVGRPVNNGELANLTGLSGATAHRRVADLVSTGRVSKTRNGREVQIRLR